MAASLPGGMALIAGGYDGVAPTAIAQVFDPVAGTFKTTGSMATARYQPTATSLLNGTVLVAGGSSSGGYLLSAELYK